EGLAGGAVPVAVLGLVAASAVGGLLVLYRARIEPTLARIAAGPLAPQPALSLTVIGHYLLLAVWPSRLVADYRVGAFGLPSTPIDGRSLVSGAVLVGVLAAGIVLLWRGRTAGVGLLWFLVALLPVAQFVPYGEVVAEHNAYLPLAGVGLAV